MFLKQTLQSETNAEYRVFSLGPLRRLRNALPPQLGPWECRTDSCSASIVKKCSNFLMLRAKYTDSSSSWHWLRRSQSLPVSWQKLLSTPSASPIQSLMLRSTQSIQMLIGQTSLTIFLALVFFSLLSTSPQAIRHSRLEQSEEIPHVYWACNPREIQLQSFSSKSNFQQKL